MKGQGTQRGEWNADVTGLDNKLNLLLLQMDALSSGVIRSENEKFQGSAKLKGKSPGSEWMI